MLSKIRESLGYDEHGNAPDLLCEQDRKEIEDGAYHRAGLDALCPSCGEMYRLHPPVQGALWLNRGCSELVKL